MTLDKPALSQGLAWPLEEEPIMTAVIPPVWAERVLRLVVRHDHFADVGGDPLETYRDTIHPTRGRRRADRWYSRAGGRIRLACRTPVDHSLQRDVRESDGY